METKERVFKGFTMNGFLAIAIILALVASCVWMFYLGATSDEWWFAGGAAMIPVCIIFLCGFGMLEPNEIYVMVFFGKYVGTYSKNGFFWTNPFLSTKKLTLRARNLDLALAVDGLAKRVDDTSQHVVVDAYAGNALGALHHHALFNARC